MEKYTLKELRERHDLRQWQVAQQLGVSIRSYSLWEQGKRYPSLTNLRKLAEFYNVMLDAIDV